MTTGVDAIANDVKMPVTRSSENSNFLNYSVLLADKRPNEVPFNRP